MKIITGYQEYIDFRAQLLEVSFIPTMGNLHSGHMSLLEKAKTYNNHTSVSIFINPLQFNDRDDFTSYPKTLDADLELLNESGCDSVFIPDATILDDIYKINAPTKSSFLCGANRPGHFDGVLTIINRLFEIVEPTYSFFGSKDYQQLLLISDYVKEKNLPITIISVDTVRENDGLAMSSRNNRLSQDDRNKASSLYRTLCAIKNEEYISSYFIQSQKDLLEQQGFTLDYLSPCNPNTLEKVSDFNERPMLVAVAASISGIRLIDNIIIT